MRTTDLAVGVLLAGATVLVGCPAAVAAPAQTDPTSAGFGQTAAAPVNLVGEANQLVGTVGAALVNVAIPCAAPWSKEGVGFLACAPGPILGQV